MKFFALIALFGAASATTAVGIEMLQQLDMVDQKMENLSSVKHALVAGRQERERVPEWRAGAGQGGCEVR